jgi:hypothetical protein
MNEAPRRSERPLPQGFGKWANHVTHHTPNEKITLEPVAWTARLFTAEPQ